MTYQHDEDGLELPHAEVVDAEEGERVGEGDEAADPERQTEQHLERDGRTDDLLEVAPVHHHEQQAFETSFSGQCSATVPPQKRRIPHDQNRTGLEQPSVVVKTRPRPALNSPYDGDLGHEP